MDFFINIFKDEWPVIAGAPLLSIMMIVVSIAIGWLLKTISVKDHIAALKAQKETAEGRLTLAQERQANADTARSQVETAFAAMKDLITLHAPIQQITTSSNTALSALTMLRSAQDEVGKSLTVSGGSGMYRGLQRLRLTTDDEKKK